MATLSPTGERYDLGRVLSRTFSQIVANWMVLGGFALIGAVVAAIINAYGMREMLHIMTNPDPANPLALFRSPGYWIMIFGGMIVGAFMQSGLTHGLLADARGESAAFTSSASPSPVHSIRPASQKRRRAKRSLLVGLWRRPKRGRVRNASSPGLVRRPIVARCRRATSKH